MTSVEIYPGTSRSLTAVGEQTAVYDESTLPYLASFGLDGFLTRPHAALDLGGLLTPDKAFPDTEHGG
jgi:hypothetical protein